VVLPELIVAGTGLVVLLFGVFSRGSGRRAGHIGLAGLAAALAAALHLMPLAGYGTLGGELWQGMVLGDRFAVLFKVLFPAVGLVVVMLAVDFVERRGMPAGEFYALVLFTVLGMMLMSGSRDLIVIYLGLETAAVSSYVLAGLLRHDPRSGEAAIKYFLTGALASAVILFGMSFVFGGIGSTDLGEVGLLLAGLEGSTEAAVGPGAASVRLLMVGLVLLMAGLAFKVAAVPFHFWAPDTYEGAPTPVTAFLSVGPKAAAFAAILRIFAPVLVGPSAGRGLDLLPLLFVILSVVSMTVGNLLALVQTNVKRMLAYSSVAHAGYILVGLAVASPLGIAAVIYYLVAYAAMNLGAFAVVIWLNNRGTGEDIRDYAGLSKRAPLAAAAMVICLVSLIGIPPTAGFFGKFYLFMAAVEAGMAWLAVLMVVNSVVSAGYYYAIVRNMYLRVEEGEPGTSGAAGAVPATRLVCAALALSTTAVLVVGLFCEPLFRLARFIGSGM
jgi:NADH-quinone oxidoreductase subunit N